MHVGAVPRAAHEDPVRLAGLGHGWKKVRPLVVLPQNVRRARITVAPENREKKR